MSSILVSQEVGKTREVYILTFFHENPLLNYSSQPIFDIGYVEEDYVKILAQYMNFT